MKEPRDVLDGLAACLTLGDLLEQVRLEYGGYELLWHHTQGEFHHDLALRIAEPRLLPGKHLVVATNCNGGVKEVLLFAEPPDIDALWRWRCPHVDEFEQRPLPPLLGLARTVHWFDPCELLAEDTRSELRPEHRVRQRGGGYCMRRN